MRCNIKMGVKFNLVAICDKCGRRMNYLADVTHTGELGVLFDSLGEQPDQLLSAQNVEHNISLPTGWVWRYDRANSGLQCDVCKNN